MREKVCPWLAQGWLASWDGNGARFLKHQQNNNMESAVEMLPKCLKEDCELWVPVHLLVSGHCGLKVKC